MPFNLTPLFPSLSPEDTLCAQEALWGLLKQQARLYAPDSTSLPVETAAALAESILLTLGAGRNPAVLLSTDLHTDFRQGQRRLSQKLMLSQHLLQTALASRPHIENRSLSDTLNSLKSFSKRWGWQFWETIPALCPFPLPGGRSWKTALPGCRERRLRIHFPPGQLLSALRWNPHRRCRSIRRPPRRTCFRGCALRCKVGQPHTCFSPCRDRQTTKAAPENRRRFLLQETKTKNRSISPAHASWRSTRCNRPDGRTWAQREPWPRRRRLHKQR